MPKKKLPPTKASYKKTATKAKPEPVQDDSVDPEIMRSVYRRMAWSCRNMLIYVESHRPKHSRDDIWEREQAYWLERKEHYLRLAGL